MVSQISIEIMCAEQNRAATHVSVLCVGVEHKGERVARPYRNLASLLAAAAATPPREHQVWLDEWIDARSAKSAVSARAILMACAHLSDQPHQGCRAE